MTLTEQICAQALVMLRDFEEDQQALLETLCRASEVSLRGKLREGLTPEDRLADFIAAASLYAVAALTEADDTAQLDQVSVGDLTLRRGSKDAASCCLRYQAELLMQPYTKDRFAFVGV